MGRKVSLNERAATEAFRAILDTTKNEKVKLQAAQLLLDNDTRNKERAFARQRQQLTNAQKKKSENLRTEVESLQMQLQSANDTITSLKAAKQEEAANLKQTINQLETESTKARVAASQACEQLSNIASYVVCHEYEPKILFKYLAGQNVLQSRTAALRIIVSDDGLSQDKRRKLAFEITQNHKEARYREPFKTFVDTIKNDLTIASDGDLEPEYARWYRREDSNDPVLLLKLATVLESASSAEQERARRMLAMFYGWTDLSLSIMSGYGERERVFNQVSARKKRSLEEVEKILDRLKATTPI